MAGAYASAAGDDGVAGCVPDVLDDCLQTRRTKLDYIRKVWM